MLQNLHTHTKLCDGNDTPEEMVRAAIEQGFDSLGFSAHAKTIYNTSWELSCSADDYIAQIEELKRAYADRIKIYIGAELDLYSAGAMRTDGLDYTIGSVHMTVKNGVIIDYDQSYEKSKSHIENDFGGDQIAYVRSYYERVAEMPGVTDYDIVGHFDLLTKFSEKHPELIDIESREYKKYALEALHAVRESRELFEVNTGAISRGHRTTPYPAPFILDEMRELGCKLVLSSDCHNKKFLTTCFDEAKEYVRSHGFDTLYYLTDRGFVGEKI